MSRSYYEFFNPVKIVSGNEALEHMPYELANLGVKKPLIITDAGVLDAGLMEPVKRALVVGEVPVAGIYSDVPPDSSTRVVSAITQFYREGGADGIIAVGGGSVIDTSKAVNILVSEGGDDLLAFSGAGALTKRLKPLFILPTTAGTGSEVTKIAVIRDDVSGRKVPYSSSFLMPDVAVLDPRMTLTLPPHITAATAMDAMTHAIEAFMGTAKNPLSDAYAVAAIKGIRENLLRVLAMPDRQDLRLKLAESATMAGIAFSNSMVGLVHAIGHSLGAITQLPHGVCMSLMLPYVLEYNLPGCKQAIGELLLPLAGADFYSKIPEQRRAAETIIYIRAMRDELFEQTELPRTLSESGKVLESQLEDIARMSVDDGALLYNRVDASYEQVLGLLKSAW
ncbi:iron-containing alcohol dehydrogenase [Endozoicomonas sp. SCSIO W0465]|uniref:iron-containing alcohol dehydrogenase n=1 Tax=Endozoicomonas sp. SCSIO W0465 TaxID=2918516 RepID=UPI00207570E0|nr:iron-containing alcohol dehydrogenase [Endozoicomonas sp. SCSIO W0465]USE36363.1 iron-containing alcohol dehydrogenase [Endozoicomonas sp. SCSIO W0465]